MSTADASRLESVFDILRRGRSPLDAFFEPASVAVIGATEKPGSVGRTLLSNLIAGQFRGRLYPVNPQRSTVLDLPAFPSIGAIGEPVDLAVIATPAPTVPGVVGQCVDAGVKAAIIISAGFREVGAAGSELERQVQSQLARGSMRVIGPNCVGVMSPRAALNATFAAGMVHTGSVAFVSQSGALLTAILDWSLAENVGFSAFVSVGSMLDVGWGDLIDYLCDDPHTQSIVIYMESIGHARSFLSAAREVALRKPVIVIKAGRTAAAAKAAASHTGSLTGSDDVLDAAFRRAGVLRVTSIAELFHMAEVLGKQPRPTGKRLTILTNAGGPGVLATDALIGDGGELATLASDTIEGLNAILPPHWSHGNPVDILGDAGPERYAKAVELVAGDPGSDGLLVVLTPQDMTDPTRTAEHLQPLAHSTGKPLLASWMGGPGVAAGVHLLNQARIPTFAFPDTAAKAFCYMWQYDANLRGLYETPLPSTEADIDRPRAAAIIDTAGRAGRTLLTEVESKQLLAAYGIPTIPTVVASDADEAAQRARAIGFPVVVKLHSPSITHKTDVGGVKLNLSDEDAVRRAFAAIRASVTEKAGAEHFAGVTVQPMIESGGYEIILGSSTDPQFGPVLLFGTGGQLVEVFQDRALGLPPLNSTLARRMMEETRIYRALLGVRGRKSVDVAALEQILVRFSWLVIDQRRINEIDINPLLVSAERIVALDARVVLHDPQVREEELPAPAIRPYPGHYASAWTLRDGSTATIRPIRPEDEPLLADFHTTLLEHSVYLRYLQVLKLSQRVAHERLARLCFIDYDREVALVADRLDPATGKQAIVGVGRLIRAHGAPQAEFAVLVSDAYQRSGLGTELLRRLLEIGRAEGVRRIFAEILPENQGMRRACQKLGIALRYSPGDNIVRAEIVFER